MRSVQRLGMTSARVDCGDRGDRSQRDALGPSVAYPPARRSTTPSGLQLSSLNPRQREAVLHGPGPMLVLAGAGSGKTRVIITRIAHLIQNGVEAERILGVTFTNKAAKEMRERLTGMIGRAGSKVLLSTFHSLGLRILREEFRAAGLRPGFCIYDQSDQMSLVRELMRRVTVADRRLDAGKILNMILEAKKSAVSEVEILEGDDYEIAVAELYPRYIEQMQAYNAVDFDDLLLRAVFVLRQDAVKARWAERFDYILVDEYQDTSPDQLELLQALASHKQNVCVVGDDDQSIYAWRGADAANILAFGRHFARTHEVILDQNYRSTGNILDAANTVIANNSQRKAKKLWSAGGPGDPVEVTACNDGEDEASFVYQQIRKLLDQGTRPDDIAILYRANSQSQVFEEKLAFERIPYRVVGGQAFLERKEVRDVIAYMALARNPRDEIALRRVINNPPRGIGPSSVQRLATHGESTGKGLWGALKDPIARAALPRNAQAGAVELIELVEEFGLRVRDPQGGHLSRQVRALIDRLRLREHVLKADDAESIAERRLDNIDEVINSVTRFEELNPKDTDLLGNFLDASSLRSKSEEENNPPGGRVTLMTLHGAKGLEFPYVFFVGVEEDLLPHKRSVELGGEIAEERRLCYVGMTRAKRRLFMCYARTRLTRGKPMPRTPSRFLQELPKEPIVHRHDRNQVLEGEAADKVADDFFAKMRAMLGEQAVPEGKA